MESNEELSKVRLEIPFPNERLATLAYHVLRVDAEPKRSGVKKVLSVLDNNLIAEFSATQPKQLRVALNGFLEKTDLITETVQNFGEPVSDTYSYF